jgi:hypothetical protein
MRKSMDIEIMSISIQQWPTNDACTQINGSKMKSTDLNRKCGYIDSKLSWLSLVSISFGSTTIQSVRVCGPTEIITTKMQLCHILLTQHICCSIKAPNWDSCLYSLSIIKCVSLYRNLGFYLNSVLENSLKITHPSVCQVTKHKKR